jgi:hypothetical protein
MSHCTKDVCAATIKVRSRSHPNCRCAGETGEEQAVQVRHDEGVAIRIGPEPCAGVRKDGREASVGACTGQPLSRENWIPLGADALDNAEGNTVGSVIASTRPTRRGRRPWHVQKLISPSLTLAGVLSGPHAERFAPGRGDRLSADVPGDGAMVPGR